MVDTFKDCLNSDEENAKVDNNKILSPFEQFFSIFNNKKKFNTTTDIINNLKCDILYLMKPVALNYLSNNTNIICKLIDLTMILHNINPIKTSPSVDILSGTKFIVELLDIEIWILDIFALLLCCLFVLISYK